MKKFYPISSYRDLFGFLNKHNIFREGDIYIQIQDIDFLTNDNRYTVLTPNLTKYADKLLISSKWGLTKNIKTLFYLFDITDTNHNHFS